MFNNEDLLMGGKNYPIFTLTFESNSKDSAYKFDNPASVPFSYTYVDPSTKNSVTKTVNSNVSQYTFPCIIGSVIKFNNLIIQPDPGFLAWVVTNFKNGYDVTPTRLFGFNLNHTKFEVTVNGETPQITYYFDKFYEGGIQ